jgi:hypothetical protein
MKEVWLNPPREKLCDRKQHNFHGVVPASQSKLLAHDSRPCLRLGLGRLPCTNSLIRLISPIIVPHKTYSPLVIDTDTVLSVAVTPERIMLG